MEAQKSITSPPPPDPAAESQREEATSKPPTSETQQRRGGHKRKSISGNSSAPIATKRHARERAAAAATTAAAAAAAAATAVSPAAKEETAVKEKTEAVTAEAVVVKCDDVAVVVDEDLEAVERKVEAEYEAVRDRDRNVHVVPIPAGWFSWTRIHPVEKRTLLSFFNGKSEKRTPEIYMEIRDRIMRKFHADPNTQIEVKDLSKLSVGEIDARQEVMEFLDHWGLINYHPFPESDNLAVNVDDKTETTNSLVDILYRFEREEFRAPVVVKDNVTTPVAPSKLFPDTTIAEELARQEEPEYHCNSCSADCSRKRYHCQIQADYDLCTECFSSGKFEDMSPVDFILMEPAEATGGSGGNWTDQETLLLLEALELFSENWNEIADHVATKTKAQCILHFVQMPIEESVMDRNDENEATNREDVGLTKTENDTSASKDESETTTGEIKADVNQPESSPMEISVSEGGSEMKVGEAKQNTALKALDEAFEAVGSDPTPGGQFSFAEAGNPAMALAAFLVRLADPNVVTATTHSSLKCITDKSSSIHLAARHCFLLEDPPVNKKKPAEADRFLESGICSAVAESAEVDAGKDEGQNKENQKHEISGSASENVDVMNDKNTENDKDDVGNEKEAPSSSKSKRTGKSKTPKKVNSNESDRTDLRKGPDIEDTKQLNELAPKTDIHSSSLLVPVDNEADKSDSAKDSVANESNDLNQKVKIPSSSVKEPGDKADEPSQPRESVKEENVATRTLTSEMKEGDEKSKDNNNENQHPATTEDEPNIDKLKRVAVTAISAAAVKSKLLADQEEDQIRQLATLLIEKQLHKLETKLAFFNDMDISVMRVREQMERYKQRLYQERAQIIATRFGLPQSTNRPVQQPSLPINRVAMSFASSAARPPMGMNMMMPPQRPPMSRPMMTSAPSSTFVPPSMTGGLSTRPINSDKTTNVTK